VLKPTWRPNDRQLRQFAVGALVAACVVAMSIWRTAPVAAVTIAVGGVALCALGLARPRALRLVYVSLIAITYPIGFLLSHLLLRLIYYGLFTPLGVVFRLRGRDPLRLKRPEGPSYWLSYQMPSDSTSYYRQG
jgi:hypothetical protein